MLASPEFIQPFFRHYLGDLLDLQSAAASDTARFERVWQISLDDAASSLSHQPTFEQVVGRLHLRRWDLGKSPAIYDFVGNVYSAKVTINDLDEPRACGLQHRAFARGGGLFRGPLEPRNLFLCDVHRPWLWVGSTVVEDLNQRPRRCVWQHPSGPSPIRVEFSQVPTGSHMTFYGGLFFDHERYLSGADVEMTIWVDGRPMGQMVHRDGDGWKRIDVALPRGSRDVVSVAIDVSSDAPHLRTFCWAGSMRKGVRALDETL